MPNNFVFDTIAQDLKTLIYGVNNGNSVPVAVDAEGNLEIGVSFTSANATITLAASAVGSLLTLDSSEKSLYSYYVQNGSGSTAPISVKLQVAPTNVNSYFIDDSSTPVLLSSDSAAVIVPKYYLNYTRLYYANTDTQNTATLVAYYDARE